MINLIILLPLSREVTNGPDGFNHAEVTWNERAAVSSPHYREHAHGAQGVGIHFGASINAKMILRQTLLAGFYGPIYSDDRGDKPSTRGQLLFFSRRRKSMKFTVD